MPLVSVNDHTFDVDMIVFDKDGTLIELAIWGKLLEKWGGLVAAELDLDAATVDALFEQLGYDLETRELLPDTPLAVGSIEQILTISSFLLFRQGVAWTTAERVVRAASEHSMEAAPDAWMLEMIGDVPSVFARLQAHGIRVGIATSDDRHPTVETVKMLGLAQWVDCIVCANDPVTKKPAPDGLYHLGELMGIPTSRMIMVGDSTGDMRCGRSAGVAGCLRIGRGTEDPTGLADTMIESIEAIVPV